MEYVKFTIVKLNIRYLALLCIVHLFSIKGGMAKDIFVVQIAAAKTPINISEFAEINKITDSIIFDQSELWNRYYIGSFDNKEMAAAYADELTKTTKLSKVFVKMIRDSSFVENPNSIKESSDIFEDLKSAALNLDIAEKDSVSISDTLFVYSGDNAGSTGNEISENFILRLLLKENEISTLKSKLVDYGNFYIPNAFRRFYFVIIESLFRYSAVLIISVLILFFILNIITVFLILNITIRNKNQKNKFVRIYGEMYEKVLMSYMFGEIDWEKASVKLKKKGKRENRKLLISILLNFKENFRGDLEKLVPEIYMKLGLQNDSLKSANSSRNYRKVRGIIELTHLYSQGAKELIPDLINDPNDYVRSEAQKAFIRLNPEEPFKFFQTLSKPFTRWTQLSAFHMLRLYQLPVPSFANYLNNEHPNIRNFSLRMIIYFQQLENVSVILQLLESQFELTRFLSYRAINDLRIYEARELIKKMYLKETDKNKLEIVKIFKNIGDDNDFEFLERILLSESVSLKTEACRSMFFMSNNGIERLNSLKNESIPEIELLLAHVADSRN